MYASQNDKDIIKNDMRAINLKFVLLTVSHYFGNKWQRADPVSTLHYWLVKYILVLKVALGGFNYKFVSILAGMTGANDLSFDPKLL